MSVEYEIIRVAVRWLVSVYGSQCLVGTWDHASAIGFKLAGLLGHVRACERGLSSSELQSRQCLIVIGHVRYTFRDFQFLTDCSVERLIWNRNVEYGIGMISLSIFVITVRMYFSAYLPGERCRSISESFLDLPLPSLCSPIQVLAIRWVASSPVLMPSSAFEFNF